MAWHYVQLTGCMFRPDGTLIGKGYSGAYECKNVPEAQPIPNRGPIPVGVYHISEPVDSRVHGPLALPLIADPSNNMFGRSHFLIHGDSKVDPGNASEGCIILSKDVREAIVASGDTDLIVSSGRV
jgi:hypothetical protein